MKYLKKFEDHSGYAEFVSGGTMVKPNVSYCDEEMEVHFNPFGYRCSYFTIVAREAGTITFKSDSALTSDYFSYIEYSIDDGITWTKNDKADNVELVVNVQVSEGDKVIWRGVNACLSYLDLPNFAAYSHFTSDCEVDVEGNIMSLLYGDDFANKKSLSGQSGVFCGLFNTSENSYLRIVDASHLVLQATKLCKFCYSAMFAYCQTLVNAPSLPALKLEEFCYTSMFMNCTSLVNPPEVSATVLADNCCGSMFWGCTSLTSSPELKATSVDDVNFPYGGMFNGCTSLTSITCYIVGESLNAVWGLENVPSNGTFTKSASATWSTGPNGIPEGWTVVDKQIA